MLDKLGRYLRWRDRTPRGPEPTINERVLDIFSVIHRHGYVPSVFIHALIGGEYSYFIQLLSRLYDWGYLDIFDEQRLNTGNRSRHTVYALNQKAIDCLVAVGRYPEIKRTDRFEHRVMSACVGVSIEAACKALGLIYIPRSELLAGRDIRLPFDDTYLEPDDLFAIQYPSTDGKKHLRRFAVEIDRSTEPHKGSDRNSSLEKKIAAYTTIYQRGLQTAWGFENDKKAVPFMTLWVTTSQERLSEILTTDLAGNPYAKRHIGRYYKTFQGKGWLIPDYPFTDILDPMQQGGGLTFDVRK